MRPFKFCRLEADTELKGFKSIDDDLNDFLLNDAKNYNAERPRVLRHEKDYDELKEDYEKKKAKKEKEKAKR